ncbi:tripartite tricarboxylate transporter permease [Anaerosphaera multitolerans]|uniref:Trap-t family transporter n=1 Tax=Anaerosphaera multitolerans TaxID=2487351 RepID=A0A437S6T0_9FIRM|nr:tripartite tricarboxylate transporter permease [Anaerosphaera multitolerans]RVU54712.1 trap-t family transporter [Anaerosphaera multitolerans]
MFSLLIQGFQIVFAPSTFLLIFAGTVLGVIFGAMPGVSASMAVALALPFAYSLNGVVAIAFLVAVYCASITGGGITAILFKIPGTPSNAPTTFDGYPMAARGEAGKALGVSLVCSAFGGLVAAFAMALVSPQLSAMALKFGPGEIFAVSFLGLSVLTALDSGNIIKTVIAGLTGLWLSTIGLDPMLGVPRFTFGTETLVSGVEMIPVMIGMFAITEVLKNTVIKEKKDEDLNKASTKTVFPSIKEFLSIKWVMLRSSILGTIVGILPGAGATIASFLSYTTETKLSKHPEKFGTGIIDGVAASETANNAATGGSMVPLLSLGIPGGNAAAIMMSALVMKGVQLGPLLLKNQPEYLSSVFASMIVTNILMVLISIFVAKIFAKILSIPYSILGPVIIMLATIGSYAVKNGTGDVKLMVIAGVIGFVFSYLKFSASALILGLVLGTMCESALRKAAVIANGNVVQMFGSPISIVLLTVCFLLLVIPIIKSLLSLRYSEK